MVVYCFILKPEQTVVSVLYKKLDLKLINIQNQMSDSVLKNSENHLNVCGFEDG